MKKDIVWLDYARCLGIFLVIFGHTLQRFSVMEENGLLKMIWDYIYLFHMLLFFVISGYLFKKNAVNIANIKLGGVNY